MHFTPGELHWMKFAWHFDRYGIRTKKVGTNGVAALEEFNPHERKEL